MIDTATKKTLRVLTDGMAWPYIEVSVSQLDEVQRLLDSRGIRYWVDEIAISMNDSPAETYINFDRGADAAIVQAILDSVY